MKTREEILNILRKIKSGLQKKYPLTKLGLFGSVAREENTPKSDVDVLVEVDPSIGLDFVDLANQIESAIGIKTDVVTTRAIKPRYLQTIQADIIYV